MFSDFELNIEEESASTFERQTDDAFWRQRTLQLFGEIRRRLENRIQDLPRSGTSFKRTGKSERRSSSDDVERRFRRRKMRQLDDCA